MTAIPIDSRGAVPMRRATATRRGLLFLFLTAPIYLVPSMLSVGHPAVLVAVLLGLTWLFLRRDGQTLSVLGLDPSWRRVGELAAGFAAGALIIVVVAGVFRLVLPFPWAWNPAVSVSAVGWSLLWLVCGNGVEELIFRGYSFDRLIAGIGHWKAQLLTALLFAAFHIMNGWPWQTAVLGTSVGHLLFAMVFLRWRSVPAAVGVHAAANWMKDLLLTDPPTAKTLLAPLSPRMWTSAEQAIAALVFNGTILVVCAALWWSIRRRRLALSSVEDGASLRDANE